LKNNDRITSLLLALLGLYVAFEGYSLKIGSLQNPKPGFLVLWAGIILAGLSLLLFIKTFRSTEAIRESPWKGVQWEKGLKIIIYLIIYVAVFKWLGFLISTFILLLLLFKSLEPQGWSVALLLSAVTTVLCLLIFGYFLELRFPQGILKEILRFFEV
jgi:putative tricarboxylic transport membrane protein